MEGTKKSTAKYWVLFAISLVAGIAMLVTMPEWSWVTFPFIGTSLALAFDVI